MRACHVLEEATTNSFFGVDQSTALPGMLGLNPESRPIDRAQIGGISSNLLHTSFYM